MIKAVRFPSLILIALVLWVTAGVYAVAQETEDSVAAWKRWKSIEAAIALRPLDGPEDIIEKAEIIEDRADDLAREKARLEVETTRGREQIQRLEDQREVLRELEEIRLSGDLRSRQRLQDISERIRREEALLKRIGESVVGLEEELARMSALAAEYREKARLLRIEEGGTK